MGNEEKKIKKAKKKKRNLDIAVDESVNVADAEENVGNGVEINGKGSCSRTERKKKKKKKHRQEEANGEIIASNISEEMCESEEKCNNDTSVEINVKKKKKKRKHVGVSMSGDETSPKKSSVPAEECSSNVVNKVDVKRKKKKRDKVKEEYETLEKEIPDDNDDDVAAASTAKERKDKKKRKTNERLCNGVGSSGEVDEREVTAGSNEEMDRKCKKKKKRKKEDREVEAEKFQDIGSEEKDVKTDQREIQDVDVTPKKKKRKHKDREMDETPLCYNSVPFNYDGGRSEANGQSFDHDKNNTVNNNATSNGLNAGQWSTASLGSGERQQKFMRLLGGFKKGGTDGKKNINLSQSGQKFSNFALNHDQEENLNTGLEKQYDQALALKLGQEKCSGFGYQAPPGAGKKYYIDKHVTKSIKFDD